MEGIKEVYEKQIVAAEVEIAELMYNYRYKLLPEAEDSERRILLLDAIDVLDDLFRECEDELFALERGGPIPERRPFLNHEWVDFRGGGGGKRKEIMENFGLTRWASWILWQDDQGQGAEAVESAVKRIEGMSQERVEALAEPVKKRRGRAPAKYLYDEKGRVKCFNPRWVKRWEEQNKEAV